MTTASKRPSRAIEKDYLTTSQVGRLFGVSPRKAQMLMDDPRFGSVRIPGSQIRRMHKRDVARALVQHGYRVPPELGGAITYHVLLAGPCPGVKAAVESQADLCGYRCLVAEDAYQAGELSVLANGDCAVIDLLAGTADARGILAGMSRSPHWSNRPAVVLGTEDESELRAFAGRPNVLGVSCPWSAADVARVVRDACEVLK